MKALTIAGHIGKDAEVRTTQNGDKVTGWTVAVDDGFGQNKRTLWFDVSLWGNRGEKLAEYLLKGTKCAVTGDLSTREHNGKTYLTVRASEVTLMGGGQQQDSGRGFADQRHETAYRGQAPAGGGGFDDGDSIPFMREDRA